MTTNNEVFEKFFPRPLVFADKAHELEMMSKWNDAKINWETALEAVTTEANKRIAELELEVQNWKDFCKKVQKVDFNDYLALEGEVAELKDAKQDLEKEVIHLQEMNEPLQADNNRLREASQALIDRWDCPKWKDVEHTGFFIDALRRIVSATPAESLAKREGWVSVPIKITEDMHIAAVKTLQRCMGNDDFPRRVYKAMIQAAPKE